MRIHHIGYLVKHMDAAISEFEKLGFSLKENGFSENTPNKRGGYNERLYTQYQYLFYGEWGILC